MPRRTRRKARPATWIDWTPDWTEVFRLVPADFEPPSQVRLHHGKSHVTAVARFRTPMGFITTARVRFEIEGREVFITGESLAQQFTLQRPQAA